MKSENENDQEIMEDNQEKLSNQEANDSSADNEIQDGGNPPKRQRHNNEDDEIRLLIPSKVAGAIIGKGGHNIQKLRTEYKVQVNIGDCQGPERVITIASPLDTCYEVIKEIMKHFEKGNADEYELRILIHQSLAGCVIGKSGAKIKSLREKIGCGLKIYSNIAPQSTDRIVQIVGKEDQCMECLNEVMDLIKTTPIKGSVNNYDPHNFDDLYADEYGGYGNGTNNNFHNNGEGGRRRFGGNGQRGGHLNDRERFGNERRGESRFGNNNRRNYVDPWDHNMTGNNAINFDIGNGFNSVNNTDVDGKSTTQVTIPKELAGAIIGKGGGRIRRIRTESNALIRIDEALPGSTDRLIVITGTPKQIQAAQYMLQQSVREGMK